MTTQTANSHCHAGPKGSGRGVGASEDRVEGVKPVLGKPLTVQPNSGETHCFLKATLTQLEPLPLKPGETDTHTNELTADRGSNRTKGGCYSSHPCEKPEISISPSVDYRGCPCRIKLLKREYS